jgi:GGDEF domain-containing protein
MGKKVTLIYTIFSILFFVALALLLYLRIEETRGKSIRATTEHFLGITRHTQETIERDIEFNSGFYQKSVGSFFEQNPRMELFSVSSESNGFEYIRANKFSYLNNRRPEEISKDPSFSFPYDPLREIKVSERIRTNAGKVYLVESIYTVLHVKDIFPLIKDTLIIILIFTIITIVVAIIMYSARTETETYKRPQPEKPVQQAEPVQPAQPEKAPAAPAAAGQKGLFSPDSQLGWQEYLDKRLTLELERSAYNEQDLTVVFIRFNKIQRGDSIYKKAAQLIIDHFTFEDLAFEYGDDAFCVIFPNVNLDSGLKMMENFVQTVSDNPEEPSLAYCRCGLSSRNGRLVSGKRLIKEATFALEKTATEGAESIIGFRPDPGKFRDYISKS